MKYIESLQNPLIKQCKKLHTKKEREKTDTLLIEGPHLIEEAIANNINLLAVIVTDEGLVPSNLHAPLYKVPVEIMNHISQTETPQGIAAICDLPEQELQWNKLQKVLLIDAVQDPGNVGTMIRTADAAGVDAVIIGKGTVDVYNDKVVRATQGAIFHVPIFKEDLLEATSHLKENNIPVFGTALENAAVYTEIQPPGSFGLIVGNEGSGVSPDVLQQTSKNLFIPIYGKSESLNVGIATGILLYYLRG
ncbi:RNA methyltransferase [Bacillus sp. HMF5848]|uniref:TrmH family RNA methyltransferase n=1 Tax=Bacillus sp. HMF5848 TaxID=2495421 RepID=UPI000F78C1D5|nr:RNA methyltransferase [Bacillus sp. HMF5848]RSK28098.1 RNA methyltransferase [Bacillus sp. HMF5848]